MIENFLFYFPQILIGSIVGMFTAWIGVFVLLRKSIFMGITLSQAITVSVIISFLLDFHSEIIVHLISILVFLPVYLLYHKVEFKEAILASGFVFYAGLGQILSSIGANIQNHIVVAYFGNILLIPEKEWIHIFFPFLIVLILIIIFYKKILAISFDLTFSKIVKMNVLFIEIIYFFILTAILSMSIFFMGSFYSIAHLVIPSLLGLKLTKNMKSAFLIALLISLFSTLTGFLISLIPIQIKGVVFNLPTSSTIILALSFFLIFLFRRNK